MAVGVAARSENGGSSGVRPYGWSCYPGAAWCYEWSWWGFIASSRQRS